MIRKKKNEKLAQEQIKRNTMRILFDSIAINY